MANTGFLVVAIEYQYNDEYYYSRSEGGKPIRVYKNKESAEQECEKLNIEAFRRTDLAGYIVDDEWSCLFDDFEKAASKYALNLDEPWNIALPVEPAKLKEFVKECKVSFYKVIEVPFD